MSARLSSIALALATFGIVWAERSLKQGAAAATPVTDTASDALLKKPPVMPFLAAMALLGVGFQVHFSLNTAPLYLRFAQAAQLEYLMPVFWVGFSLLTLAASRLVARFGGVWVMAIAACVGAWATWLTTVASALPLLVVAQFVAGGAWGILMMSAFTSALVIGRTGREGLVTGSMFSLLALAAFARISIVAAQLNKDASLAPLIAWLPTVAWVVAGLVLMAMARLLRGQRLRTAL